MEQKSKSPAGDTEGVIVHSIVFLRYNVYNSNKYMRTCICFVVYIYIYMEIYSHTEDEEEISDHKDKDYVP